MLGATAVTTLGGTVAGMFVGDALGAIPQSANVPATSNSATAKVTGSGKIVTKGETPRQSLMLSGGIVFAAMGVLIFGSKILKDARIG